MMIISRNTSNKGLRVSLGKCGWAPHLIPTPRDSHWCLVVPDFCSAPHSRVATCVVFYGFTTKHWHVGGTATHVELTGCWLMKVSVTKLEAQRKETSQCLLSFRQKQDYFLCSDLALSSSPLANRGSSFNGHGGGVRKAEPHRYIARFSRRRCERRRQFLWLLCCIQSHLKERIRTFNELGNIYCITIFEVRNPTEYIELFIINK